MNDLIVMAGIAFVIWKLLPGTPQKPATRVINPNGPPVVTPPVVVEPPYVPNPPPVRHTYLPPVVPVGVLTTSITGRVMTAYGTPLRQMQVTLTNLTSGLQRTLMTSSFGEFNFDKEIVGNEYDVTVYSRRYQFADGYIQSLPPDGIDLEFVAATGEGEEE